MSSMNKGTFKNDIEYSNFLNKYNVDWNKTCILHFNNHGNIKHDIGFNVYYNHNGKIILIDKIDNMTCKHDTYIRNITELTTKENNTMFKAINHYTKQEKQYQFLTLEECKQLTGHALIVSNKGDIIRVKINGMVKTWKKDNNRFSVPVKYGLYECTRIEELNRFCKEV